MFPSYVVNPEDTLEIAFAISELGEDASRDQIAMFSGESDRKVRESIKVLREIGVIVSEEDYTLAINFEDLLQEIQPEERAVIIEEALITYQPFIDYATYLNRGYASEEAAKMVHSAHDIASKPEYLSSYLERLGKFSGILTGENQLSLDIRDIPANSTASIEKLRDALESKLEVRVYLDEVLGEEIMHFLDEDTKSDLTDGFTKHVTSPRDSISASGRAFEDFLRSIGNAFGDEDRNYSSASGIIQVCNHLQGDDLVKKLHKRRVFAIAEVRNKGGAHGDDAERLERWKTSPEVSLDCALSTTLLIRSIYQYSAKDNLVL